MGRYSCNKRSLIDALGVKSGYLYIVVGRLSVMSLLRSKPRSFISDYSSVVVRLVSFPCLMSYRTSSVEIPLKGTDSVFSSDLNNFL